jgi:hypothetical protein
LAASFLSAIDEPPNLAVFNGPDLGDIFGDGIERRCQTIVGGDQLGLQAFDQRASQELLPVEKLVR